MNRVFLAPITESTRPSALLTPCDLLFIEGLGSRRRREEVTAWRSLLRESLIEAGYAMESMCEIEYDENRAPYLVGGELHFGVSHSRTMAAVIISDRPCAIDIEDYTRNFTTVARRFTTQEERAIVDVEDERMVLPILWSAKETLYKISRRTGLDLIHDLEVVGREGDRLHCRVSYLGMCELRSEIRDGHVMVHTI